MPAHASSPRTFSPRTPRAGALARALFTTTALACAIAGCGPSHGQAYRQAIAEANRAENAGRFVEASAKYDAAAGVAKVPRDAEHARFLSAMMQKRAGNLAEATARLRVIAATPSKTAATETAEFQLAEMMLTSGDPKEGLAGMETFFRRHPSSGLARPALARVLREKDATAGPRATLDYLRLLERDLGASDLGETLAYEAASRLASLGEKVAARDAFVAVADRWPYPGGKLFDDALFRASELEEELGHYEAAIAHLTRMLRERETTTLLGSYQRPRFTPALMRVAQLYRDRLHDRARAREALHRLYTDFTTSTLRDDALFEEASLFREDGDSARACARLTTLVSDFPDSRYVACAVDRCPAIARPLKSRAPAACPAYITRAAQNGTGEDDAHRTPR